jgi:molybdate transport system substrate-binding protein
MQKSNRSVAPIRRVGALVVLVALSLTLVLAGCGGGSTDKQLTVFAASSLQEPFTGYAHSFQGADIRQSFAGSDQLAAQIRQGAGADVFASASTEYPDQLHRDGLVGKPRIFAGNRLVIAVPKGSTIDSLQDLARPGTSLVIGDSAVPVGGYTREVLARLPSDERRAIMANVGSEEPEVTSIVGKLSQGAADAGFVYLSDVHSAGGELRAIRLPARLQPDVTYAVAIVSGAQDRGLAKRFVDGLFGDRRGARSLRQAGFLPPP